jgi:hypothetical protein
VQGCPKDPSPALESPTGKVILLGLTGDGHRGNLKLPKEDLNIMQIDILAPPSLMKIKDFRNII